MEVKLYHTGALQVNTYLVYDDTKEAFIVDPGGYSNDLAYAVEKLGLNVRYILLTHGHFDHIGGVPDFQKEYPEAVTVGFEKEKKTFADSRMNISSMFSRTPMFIKVDQYVEDNETMKIGDMELKFLFTPGHTPGGMSILLENVVFCGDTLFQQSIGRTDFPGGSFEVLADSIRNRLYTLPEDTIVLPGHMGQTTIGAEKAYNMFVRG